VRCNARIWEVYQVGVGNNGVFRWVDEVGRAEGCRRGVVGLATSGCCCWSRLRCKAIESLPKLLAALLRVGPRLLVLACFCHAPSFLPSSPSRFAEIGLLRLDQMPEPSQDAGPIHSFRHATHYRLKWPSGRARIVVVCHKLYCLVMTLTLAVNPRNSLEAT
jgi:hypothetical protein